jgi:hypothetical protein
MGSSGSLRGTPASAIQPSTSKPRSDNSAFETSAACSWSASDHALRPVLRARLFAASSPAERANLTASLYDFTRTIRRPVVPVYALRSHGQAAMVSERWTTER